MRGPVDIEAALVTALPAPCSTTVPNPRPDAFTRVLRAGGAPRNIAQNDTRVLIECWALNEGDAFDRARTVWATLWAAQHSFLAPGVWVSRISMSDPANFPDGSSNMARYTFTATLTTSTTEVS